MKALLSVLMVLSSASAFATEKCEFHINEARKDAFVATGKTKSEVIEKAATMCFNVYEELALRTTGHGLQQDDKGFTIADTCTNICDKHGG